MNITFDELKRRIEKKIESLEQEKTRLRNDLAVVRQAIDIAAEFQEEPAGAVSAVSEEDQVKRPVGWS